MSNPFRRKPRTFRVGCPFCWEWIPTPKTQLNVFSPEGCLGGRCECGAVFVVDETGKAGGQALLDVQALACDGDLDRAMTLETGVDVDVETRPVQAQARSLSRGPQGGSYMTPKVWFVRFKKRPEDS